MESSAGVVNKLLVAAPIVAMAIIGILARSATPNYTFVASSHDQNAAIMAYAKLVKETRLKVKNPTAASADAARKVAREWIDSANSGRLVPLEPCAFDDNSRDGVKAEIVRANLNVAEALDEAAYREKLAGQADRSAKDAALGALVLQVTKFSDFSSVSACSMVQRRCLSQIKDVADQLSPQTRTEVEKEIQALREDDGRLGLMAIRTRQMFLQYQLRHGENLATVQATQKALSLDEFAQSTDLEGVAKKMRATLKGARFEPFAALITDVRLGYQSQVETDRRLNELFVSNKAISV